MSPEKRSSAPKGVVNTQAGHEESVINRMSSEWNSRRDEVRALRSEVGRDEPKVSSAESNAMNRSRDDNIHTEESIPVERLLVLSGTMNGLSIKVLKDDGCNTNVVSREFLAKYRSRNIFEVCQEKLQFSTLRREQGKKHQNSYLTGLYDLELIPMPLIGSLPIAGMMFCWECRGMLLTIHQFTMKRGLRRSDLMLFQRFGRIVKRFKLRIHV